jgi:hypothetical protein
VEPGLMKPSLHYCGVLHYQLFQLTKLAVSVLFYLQNSLFRLQHLLCLILCEDQQFSDFPYCPSHPFLQKIYINQHQNCKILVSTDPKKQAKVHAWKLPTILNKQYITQPTIFKSRDETNSTRMK